MTVREEWKDLIQAAEDLEMDGEPLEVRIDDDESLRYAIIALIIHSSQLEARGVPWRFALDVHNNLLYIYKMSAAAEDSH